MVHNVPVKRERFEALDMLRGAAIVIMALDHSRDFLSLGFVQSDPTDLDVTTPEIFLTRWMTHLAAPTFMFLAGIGLFFASMRRTRGEVARLAWTRGLWLIFLELTLVGFFWSFTPDFLYTPKLAVLFALGISMIAMAVIVYLPRWGIATVALLMIFGHNLLDALTPETFGPYAWLWHLIHVPGTIGIFDAFQVRVVYPMVPWIGVMALGYLFGPVTKLPRVERKAIFLRFGLLLLVSGVMLRWFNGYGDPSLWQAGATMELTVLSFLNVTKYPPSLIYLCLFLGIAMIMMSLFDREKMGAWSYPLRVVGQVPFFVYVTHIPLLHLGGVVLAMTVFGHAQWLFGVPVGAGPEGYTYGFRLLPTYVGWIAVMVILFYPARWFARLKTRRKDWWLSYL